MNATGLAPLLLVFPLLGFLFNAVAGRRFVEANQAQGEKWSGWVASAMALSAFVVAVALYFSLPALDYHAQIVKLFDWINVGALHIPWAMQIDTLSVTMMLVVTGVGSLIHIYAIGYMHGDKDFSRFFAYLNLFLFFMLILVTGNNYLMLFVGWEGVGLCSFLLIGFWFDKVENSNAARKAFVANRVGDLAMILAMGLLFWTFRSLEFESIFEQAVAFFREGHHVEAAFGAGKIRLSLATILSAVTALFLMGAAGKSAQIPLYIWLPDAMAGPTPVSALIHAATMVTSGIYLIVRSNVLFEIVRVSEQTLFWGLSANDLVAYVGAATALFAGMIAFTQFDIKKVLAYSTVSQLGFMIAAAGMGAYVAAMFHLVTHAFFKALLFLSSGSVIHGMEHGHHEIHDHGHDHHDEHASESPAHDDFDPQDMRTMGNLKKHMPTTSLVFHVGALALAGVVPLAGFWSKDEILAHAGEHYTPIYIMLTLAAICTAFYMGRQLKMVFHGEERHEAAKHAHESPPLMTRPLLILMALSILGGGLNIPFFSESQKEHAEESHDFGIFLALEHWLEHSIGSFALSEAEGTHNDSAQSEVDDHGAEAAATEGGALLHLPHTPVVFSPVVAGLSTLFGVGALAAAFYGVYGNKPQNADDKDPLQVAAAPAWNFFSALPINYLGMSIFVPAFNRLAHFLGIIVDWEFYHNFFHENIIRDGFVGISRITSDLLDKGIVDGLLVNGAGKLTRKLAELTRLTQTGYVRNYAFSVFLGVVALLAYFVLAN